MNVSLIGFCGSGKSSVAKYLQDNHNFNKFSFAEELKTLAELMLGRKIDKAIDRAFLQDLGQILKKSPENMSVNDQKVMQNWFNNEIFFKYWQKNHKDMFKNNFYAKKLFEEKAWDYLQNGSKVVIDDMRFQVEANYAKTYWFKIVRLNASKELCANRCLRRDGNFSTKTFDDISEIEWQSIKADIVIDVDENTTVEEIVGKVLKPVEIKRKVAPKGHKCNSLIEALRCEWCG